MSISASSLSCGIVADIVILGRRVEPGISRLRVCAKKAGVALSIRGQP